MGIPLLKIRRSWDRLIFKIGNPYTGIRHVTYIETTPWFWGQRDSTNASPCTKYFSHISIKVPAKLNHFGFEWWRKLILKLALAKRPSGLNNSNDVQFWAFHANHWLSLDAWMIVIHDMNNGDIIQCQFVQCFYTLTDRGWHISNNAAAGSDISIEDIDCFSWIMPPIFIKAFFSAGLADDNWISSALVKMVALWHVSLKYCQSVVSIS